MNEDAIAVVKAVQKLQVAAFDLVSHFVQWEAVPKHHAIRGGLNRLRRADLALAELESVLDDVGRSLNVLREREEASQGK